MITIDCGPAWLALGLMMLGGIMLGGFLGAWLVVRYGEVIAQHDRRMRNRAEDLARWNRLMMEEHPHGQN